MKQEKVVNVQEQEGFKDFPKQFIRNSNPSAVQQQ